MVSIADPEARPICKGKLGKPTEFGYVAQIAEVSENTRRGACGFILPAATRRGNPAETRCFADTITELDRLAITPRELVCDGAAFRPPIVRARLPCSGGPGVRADWRAHSSIVRSWRPRAP